MNEDSVVLRPVDDSAVAAFRADVAAGQHEDDEQFKAKALEVLGLTDHRKAGLLWRVAWDLGDNKGKVFQYLVELAPFASDYNPYEKRVQRAIDTCDRIEGRRDRLNASAIPGSYVTGNSGVKASYRRRVDRQLDRTIDLAVAWRKARDDRNLAERSFYLYAIGKIDAQGRSIRPAKPAKPAKTPKRQQSAAQKEISRITRAAMMSLSIDGVAEVAGARIAFYHFWDEQIKELVGLVVVTKDGTRTEHRCDSAQGVSMEDKARKVIRDLLKEQANA